MPRKSSNASVQLLEQAKARLSEPVDVDSALQKLGAAGNTALARRLATGSGSYRSEAYGLIGAHLLAMAPGRPRTLQRAVMLYVPDGAYQMQVFAIDDGQDNSLVVCCEDVLEIAIAAGVIAPVSGTEYRIADSESRLTLTIEQFDGKSENPPPYINAMTGWNRKAMRIILPPTVQKEQVDAALLLCALSAANWKTAPAKTV